jgi:hypothetical protein
MSSSDHNEFDFSLIFDSDIILQGSDAYPDHTKSDNAKSNRCSYWQY